MWARIPDRDDQVADGWAPPRVPLVHEVIGALVDEGLCDADIAARTHYTVGHVAVVRRGLGKAPNRRYPPRPRYR